MPTNPKRFPEKETKSQYQIGEHYFTRSITRDYYYVSFNDGEVNLGIINVSDIAGIVYFTPKDKRPLYSDDLDAISKVIQILTNVMEGTKNAA